MICQRIYIHESNAESSHVNGVTIRPGFPGDVLFSSRRPGVLVEFYECRFVSVSPNCNGELEKNYLLDTKMVKCYSKILNFNNHDCVNMFLIWRLLFS